jgi:hypothetical protein
MRQKVSKKRRYQRGAFLLFRPSPRFFQATK